MTLADSSSVAVDGAALRRIREQKRLTQFYVSKVVGVTTDTVSRWENNRYPTIRRENAVNLADALEVDLEEILRQDKEDQTLPGNVEQGPLRKWWPVVLLILTVPLFIWLLLFYHKAAVDPQLQAQRMLPAHVAPGHELLVQVTITSETPLKGVILKEEFPSEWEFISSEPEVASVDQESGVARWIFRNPTVPLYLYYRLAVPREIDLDNDIRITGELIANPDGQQAVMPVVASEQTTIRPFHWADTNRDYMIDDMEILIFSELTENTSELDNEWFVVEQIWHAGAYRWDEKNFRFVPQSTDKKVITPGPGNN